MAVRNDARSFYLSNPKVTSGANQFTLTTIVIRRQLYTVLP